MMQKTYKIYLTKDYGVASLLQDALWENYKTEVGCSSGFGCVDNENSIPELYHGRGYFYARVEYESERPKNELIFA